MNVSVVGLGKLGSCLLAVLASHHDVIGVDLDTKLVQAVNAGLAPFPEPGLQELLDTNKGRYRATTGSSELAGTDITFIIVPTPSLPGGRFSNDYVTTAISSVGTATRDNPRHIIAIVSTVMPGSVNGVIREHAEYAARRNVRLGYCPTLVALGNVVHDLLHPDTLIIGTDEGPGDLLVEETDRGVILQALNPGPWVPIARLSILEAEIAKIALNCFVTTKVSFANTVGEACDELDADPFKICAALGMDSRIGPKYFQPATPVGGTCFPRDGEAFLAFAGDAPLVRATIEVNNRQVIRAIRRIERAAPGKSRAAILGLAYKTGTPIVERSFGVELAQELVNAGYAVTVHDPMAIPAAREVLGHEVWYAVSAEEAISNSDIVVVTLPDPAYKGLKCGDRVVVDFWA